MRTLASSALVGRVAGELARRPRPPAPRVDRLVSVPAHEGPVFVAREEALYYTTVPRPGGDGGPRVDVCRLDLRSLEVRVVREDAAAANGMCLHPDGRSLLVCEQGTMSRPARIARLDLATGAAATVCDAWRGRPLSSPNDVVAASDGTIWFTDPSYGFLQGFRPPPEIADRVYRHDPRTGRTVVVATGFDKPNGLAFSPDERTLYVADNGAPSRLYAFDVSGGRLHGRRVLAAAAPGHPDGVGVDRLGRVLSTTAGGIAVRSSTGRLLRELEIPGAVNFCFGPRGRLFITTDDAIWQAKGV